MNDGDKIYIQSPDKQTSIRVTYKAYRTIWKYYGFTIFDPVAELPNVPPKDGDQEPPKDGGTQPPQEPQGEPWTLERYKSAILKKPNLIAELDTLKVQFVNGDTTGKLRALLYDTLEERGLLPEGAKRYDS